MFRKITPLLRYILLVTGCSSGLFLVTILSSGYVHSIYPDCLKQTSKTILDVSTLLGGISATQIWRVKNCGNTTWDGYQLVQLGESIPNLERSPLILGSEVSPLRPGEDGAITVVFDVPEEPGNYLMVFMVSPDMVHVFPNVLWVMFKVKQNKK